MHPNCVVTISTGAVMYSHADRARSAPACVERQPLRPVPTQLEHVIEEGEAARFELRHEGAKCVFVVHRPDDNQVALNAEFVWREVETRVELRACQPGVFKGRSPEEE